MKLSDSETGRVIDSLPNIEIIEGSVGLRNIESSLY